MSHFSVLVIGDNIDAQLQPYHEFECTGVDDEFVQDLDITDELRNSMTGDEPMTLEEALSWHGLEERVVQHESEVDKTDTHKYGYAVVKSGQLLKAVRRTNPNKTWDWWQVGGRWPNFLLLKNGARTNTARRGDVDFGGMRDAAGAEAAARFDKVMGALSLAVAPKTWRTWEQCRGEDHKGDIEAARGRPHAQPSVAAIKACEGFFSTPDSFLVSREAYIGAARDRACVTYALVIGGKWHAKGKMGWFGMSADKVAQDDWNGTVNALLEAAPPDTLLTVVDCHI